jgi:hypothetical protein
MEKNQNILVRVLIALVLTLSFTACNKKETAKVRLHVPEYKNYDCTVEQIRVSGKKHIDTLTFSAAGKLRYKLDAKKVSFYNFSVVDGKTIYLLVHPGENIKVTSSDSGIVISGSDDSQKLNLLYTTLNKTRAQLSAIQEQYNLSVDAALRDSLEKEYEAAKEAHHRFSIQFVLENMTSLASLAALYQEIRPNEFVFAKARDLQFYKLVSDSLLKYYPRHRHVLALSRNYKSMMKSYQVNKLMNTVEVVEDEIPDLELPDLNGRKRRLQALQGKYVFLNFWHENDQTSNRLFMEYKKVHNNFAANDFEVYNVYLGKSLEAWKSTVRFEEIEDWINVADTAFPGSTTQMAYNIQVLPTNYLIDLRNKEIVARDLLPRELNQNLAKLLAK